MSEDNEAETTVGCPIEHVTKQMSIDNACDDKEWRMNIKKEYEEETILGDQTIICCTSVKLK